VAKKASNAWVSATIHQTAMGWALELLPPSVAHWWGVDVQTVSKWRRILRVRRATEGTHRLHSEYATNEPGIVEGRRKSVAKARDPDRRAKIAAARRGKCPPRHVIEAMRQARLGSHHTEETRRQMSETHRQRGTLVPGIISWTPEEDKLVRTLPTQEAVRRTGRTLNAVRARRRRLGVPDGRRR
jgi:hypothetical protein